MGAIVEEAAVPFDYGESGGVWLVHWLSSLQRLLQLYPAERHGEFDPALVEQAKTGAAYSVQTLVEAQVRRRDIAHAWAGFFTRYDLLIAPTLSQLPFAVGRPGPEGPDGKPILSWACTPVFNLTRQPAASVPCGLSRDGLPIGLQIVSACYRDPLVLAACAAYQAADPPTWPDLPRE
jgi:aspartyl-tRNA(Asn)/glutamyl-tRNA(Gln) amidotransferase subunit A